MTSKTAADFQLDQLTSPKRKRTGLPEPSKKPNININHRSAASSSKQNDLISGDLISSNPTNVLNGKFSSTENFRLLTAVGSPERDTKSRRCAETSRNMSKSGVTTPPQSPSSFASQNQPSDFDFSRSPLRGSNFHRSLSSGQLNGGAAEESSSVTDACASSSRVPRSNSSSSAPRRHASGSGQVPRFGDIFGEEESVAFTDTNYQSESDNGTLSRIASCRSTPIQQPNIAESPIRQNSSILNTRSHLTASSGAGGTGKVTATGMGIKSDHGWGRGATTTTLSGMFSCPRSGRLQNSRDEDCRSSIEDGESDCEEKLSVSMFEGEGGGIPRDRAAVRNKYSPVIPNTGTAGIRGRGNNRRGSQSGAHSPSDEEDDGRISCSSTQEASVDNSGVAGQLSALHVGKKQMARSGRSTAGGGGGGQGGSRSFIRGNTMFGDGDDEECPKMFSGHRVRAASGALLDEDERDRERECFQLTTRRSSRHEELEVSDENSSFVDALISPLAGPETSSSSVADRSSVVHDAGLSPPRERAVRGMGMGIAAVAADSSTSTTSMQSKSATGTGWTGPALPTFAQFGASLSSSTGNNRLFGEQQLLQLQHPSAFGVSTYSNFSPMIRRPRAFSAGSVLSSSASMDGDSINSSGAKGLRSPKWNASFTAAVKRGVRMLGTPRSAAAHVAAQLGDLGTPVTEVGSPADIDIDASMEEDGPGDSSPSFSARGGGGGYHQRTVSNSNFGDYYEQSVLSGNSSAMDSPGAANTSALSQQSQSQSHHATGLGVGIGGGGGGRSGSSKSESVLNIRGRNLSSGDLAGSSFESTSRRSIVTALDGSFSRSSSRNTTFNNGASNSSKSNNNNSKLARPLPDQGAFERSVNGGPAKASPAACPATPMRTPTWVHDSAEKQAHRSFVNGLPTFDRLKDALANKVLLSMTDPLSYSSSSSSPSTSVDDLEISFRKDFQEEGLLGSGAFADVFKVREKDSKVYAVKKSKLQFRSVKERDQMMSEVLTMQRLGNCDFIVRLIRAWQEDAHFYVQFELAERGCVKDLLADLAARGQEVPERTIWHVAHDVSAGLQHIHNCGMVHLDIKPANLLISDKGTIKIGDFGMAMDQGSGEDGHEGDTRYFARELLESNDRYPPADIFSLGITLYELCMAMKFRNLVANGHSALPSEGQDWHDLREGRVPPLDGRSHDLCQIILACLSPKPSDRPSTQQVRSLPALLQAGDDTDPLLSTAMPAPPVVAALYRCASFNPNMAGPAEAAAFLASGVGGPRIITTLGDPSDPIRAQTPTGDVVRVGGGSFWNFGYGSGSSLVPPSALAVATAAAGGGGAAAPSVAPKWSQKPLLSIGSFGSDSSCWYSQPSSRRSSVDFCATIAGRTPTAMSSASVSPRLPFSPSKDMPPPTATTMSRGGSKTSPPSTFSSTLSSPSSLSLGDQDTYLPSGYGSGIGMIKDHDIQAAAAPSENNTTSAASAYMTANTTKQTSVLATRSLRSDSEATSSASGTPDSAMEDGRGINSPASNRSICSAAPMDIGSGSPLPPEMVLRAKYGMITSGSSPLCGRMAVGSPTMKSRHRKGAPSSPAGFLLFSSIKEEEEDEGVSLPLYSTRRPAVAGRSGLFGSESRGRDDDRQSRDVLDSSPSP